MHDPLNAIISSLTQPAIFPLRLGEAREMYQMENISLPVKQHQGRILRSPGQNDSSPKALLIHGSDDHKIPLQDALSIHRQLPQSRLLRVKKAGHPGVLHHHTTLQAISIFVSQPAPGEKLYARAY